MHSEDGKHPECADTEREEHDRRGGEGGPDTTTCVLSHQGSVAGDTHDEDKDGQEQDRVQRLREIENRDKRGPGMSTSALPVTMTTANVP